MILPGFYLDPFGGADHGLGQEDIEWVQPPSGRRTLSAQVSDNGHLGFTTSTLLTTRSESPSLWDLSSAVKGIW